MAKLFKVLQQTPTFILAGLIAGVLVSVGHHLYYASIDGTSPEGDRILAGYKISNQTFTSTVGTAFAFVVRAFVLFAVSGAYVQMFWHAATNTRRVNTLEEIDALFSIFSNIFAFRQGSIWLKYPMLLFIALVGWLLPIAFTISPASLSVIVVPVTTLEVKTVPNVDFANLRYVDYMPRGFGYSYKDNILNETFTTYEYIGPSTIVQKVANLVAEGGSILPITPPAANSSWQLDFHGPSLSCYPLDWETRLEIECNIAIWLSGWIYAQATGTFSPAQLIGYFVWSYDEEYEINPFANVDDWAFSAGSVESSFLVAVAPNQTVYGETCDKMNLTAQSQPLGPGNMTFLRCDLHNSSYLVNFNYESGRQSVATQVESTERVATFKSNHRPILNPETILYDINATSLRVLSYTAIADSFYQIIKGSSINYGTNSLGRLASTVLFDTPELSFLQTSNRYPIPSTLQGDISNTSRGQSLCSPHKVERIKPLQNALEEMFQNITVSLLSSELLQPNMTSEFAPPMPIVTTTTYEPIYRYSPRQLWIAYGVAIAVSAVASLLGFLAIFLNDASYGNDFSSVYRTAHGSGLDVTIQPKDMKATAPLPRYLAKAALCITNPSSRATNHMSEDEQTTTLITTAQGPREALINQTTGASDRGDNEPRDLDRSNTGSYVSLTQFVDVDIQGHSPA
ncbi:hypothetical protein GQX73_g8969 [Xylaria multiplex]|uniref:Uncharacterized protein n=1 Tax=Xylaria multiplex TaxID=323545 RepID=A0A7C8MM34_9PEZI|nr:hypothetical protein GQX73_g8969 [Xylaria multiplex]